MKLVVAFHDKSATHYAPFDLQVAWQVALFPIPFFTGLQRNDSDSSNIYDNQIQIKPSPFNYTSISLMYYHEFLVLQNL